jgi:hypothetical protein
VTRSPRATPCWLLLLALGGSCGGGDGLEVLETVELEAIVVERTDGPAICVGTYEAWDDLAQSLAATLEVEPTGPLRLVIGDNAVKENCDLPELGLRAGCQLGVGDDAVAYALPEAVPHELVHLLRSSEDRFVTSFVEEGLAEMLGAGVDAPFHAFFGTPLEGTGPAKLMREAGAHELDYVYGPHFFAWLVSVYGLDAVVSFANGPASADEDQVEGAFIDAFGVDIDEADSMWRTVAFPGQMYGSFCPEARTSRWNDATIVITGELSCGSGGGFEVGDGLRSRAQCVVPPEDGPVDVRVSFAPGADERTQLRVLLDDCDQARTQAFDRTEVLSPGQSATMQLGACATVVFVEGPTDADSEYRIELAVP